jgi:hypothetical protein
MPNKRDYNAVFKILCSLTLVTLVIILDLAKIKINFSLDQMTTEFSRQGNMT